MSPASLYESVFNCSAEGRCLVSPTAEATIIAVNDALLRFSGRQREAFIGASLFEVFPCDPGDPCDAAVDALRSSIRRAIDTGTPQVMRAQRYPIQVTAPGGELRFEERYWSAVNTPVFDHEQRLVCIAHTTTDVTERYRSDEALRLSEGRLRAFITATSDVVYRMSPDWKHMHQLDGRGFLKTTAGLDEYRIEEYVHQDDLALARNAIDEAIRGKTVFELEHRVVRADHSQGWTYYMTSLVDDLLDVSRVTRGLVALENTALDLRQVVAEAVEQSAPLVQARRQHLAMQLAAEATVVMGDAKRLVQVVANLVNNAAKYTPEGGNIAVATHLRQGRVVLEVRDDGIGIDPRMTTSLFDLFAQAEVTSARSSGGLGLGLALVKSIVELHGGTVCCDSPGTGKGSTFTVCLPLLDAPAVAAVPGKAGPAPAATVRPLRLMIVDDNVDAATMLALLLEDAGHAVFAEHSPVRALERAHIEAPDVCLLDIGLPEMDGNALAQRLRAQPETAHSLLVAITGYGQDHDRQRSLEAGFDHHLVKPVDTAALMAILAQARR